MSGGSFATARTNKPEEMAHKKGRATMQNDREMGWLIIWRTDVVISETKFIIHTLVTLKNGLLRRAPIG